MSLENKVAIITGGADGIGYAIAERFARERAKVIIADIDDAMGKEAAVKLQKINSATYIHCDVSQKLDIHNLVAHALDEYGQIDILVNNAGMVAGADFLDLEEEDFDRVLDVNLKGSFLCGQAVARHMVKRVKEGGPAGNIVNISSINAVLAIANQVPYSVSKGGLKQLTNVMALALAEYNIRVNAIGPGSVATSMLNTVINDKNAKNRILERTPIGRIGEPSEIAAVAAFLASDDASFITGETIYADGGRLGLAYTVPVKEEE